MSLFTTEKQSKRGGMDRFTRAVFLSLFVLLVRCAQTNPITTPSSGDVQTTPRDAVHDSVSVAKCRLRCLDEFLLKEDDSATVDEDECDKDKECSVCWKICDYLQQDFPTWGEMCIFPHEICYDGCIQACLYHLDQDMKTHYSATAVIDGYAFPSQPKVTGNRITWLKAEEEKKSPIRNSNNRRKTIYSVLVAPEGSEWILVGQTLHTKIRLEADKRRSGTSRLMVIAVMKEGVVAVTRSSFVVSPSDPPVHVPTEPSPGSNLRPNGLPWNIPMASEIGKVMDGPPPGYIDSRSHAAPGSAAMFMFETQSPMGMHPEVVTSAYSQTWEWDLHAKSVTRNPVFRTVDAVVAWNPRPSRQGEYMVTWEVNKENFGVKGHVYTRNASVTLNLNPEEVYRVQVEYISRAKQESEASPVILIDTHNITSPSYWSQDMSNQVNKFFFRSKFEMVIMVLVGFCAVVLTFVAFFVWRMKRKQIMKKMRAEYEARDAHLESGVLDYDRSKTSLLLSDHRRQNRPPVTPMTVSTATSPFEFDSNMFPKVFRFPSVSKSSSNDSSVTQVLLETSPKTSLKNKETVLSMPSLVQSMPNIAPDALETHVTRFKNLQMPSSRASVAIGSSSEFSFSSNNSVLTLKVPPLGKRGKLANGCLENNNNNASTSLHSVNEFSERS